MLIQVYDSRKLMCEEFCEAFVELGRKEEQSSEALYINCGGLPNGGARIHIAPPTDRTMSRKAVRISPVTPSAVLVENLSTSNSIWLTNGDIVPPQGARQINLPALLNVGNAAIRVQPDDDGADDEEAGYTIHRLASPTIIPGKPLASLRLGTQAASPKETHDASLAQWFATVNAVLNSAINSDDFFRIAVKALVDLVGLDCGRAVMRVNGQFDTVFEEYDLEATKPGPPTSRTLLQKLVRERRTLWKGAADMWPESSLVSLIAVEAVIAAPILDAGGQVIGALYGFRNRQSLGIAPQISQLEAMLVETLATGVAAGLARAEQQKAALAAQFRFEQFFTPELSKHLTEQPDLLEGRDAAVTMLFCDVRGFSRISEKLSPSETVRWIGDVMSVLSECVVAHHGVLVDYIGDELMAMWGAPATQPDHAELACRAALDMLKSLETLNAKWHSIIGEPTLIGIGINTGTAHVGNTGSQRKFKYGPLGASVNLASRVQGATKYLRTDLIVTEATCKSLQGAIPSRHLCKVRVVNISEPVGLYQLPASEFPRWKDLCQQYERALNEFEARRFSDAARILGKLVAEFPDDGPSLVLLARAVNAWIENASERSTVWIFPESKRSGAKLRRALR